MTAIHVFAIDWVPSANDIASGGGLRSLQVIEALRDAGYTVTYSVPADCRHIRRVGRNSRALRNIETHDASNQLDILTKIRPDIVVWQAPLIRGVPFTGMGEIVHICDLIGLPHIEASLGSPALEAPIRQRLRDLVVDADLVLTGSEEQNGYWLAALGDAREPPPTAIVPYALPRSLQGAAISGPSELVRLHVTGMVYPWSTSIDLLERVADWVAGHPGITLAAIVGVDAGGATDRSIIQRLRAIAAHANVVMPGEVSFARAMADYRPGSVDLELYTPTLERRMAVPIRAVTALAHGVPILSTVDSTMMRALKTAGAGLIAQEEPIEAALDRLAALPAKTIARMSDAARRFAARHYAPETAAVTLVDAVAAALDRRKMRAVAPPVAPATAPHVLVISNVEPHHRELRVEVPFNVLYAEQAISGYTVWSRGEFVSSTSTSVADQDFDAIWVQREISPDVAVALRLLGRPFVYDIDDNLLASPAYRPPFAFEMVQTVATLIRSCSVLSCSTARLAALLEFKLRTNAIHKTIVTPNMLREAPLPRPLGPPRFVIWGSSDTPALTQSRLDVIRAIRDFCLTNNSRLVCLGAPPPDLIQESAVDVRHVRQIPYGSYLALLRSLAPAIMVCPLEADADPETQHFIDAKSDLKILEALGGGLIGVFSRARPYLDSTLPAPILCDNTYAGWMEAMLQAARRCAQPADPSPVPVDRYANPTSVMPWLDAIHRVRLPRPISQTQFVDALKALRGRYGIRLLSEAEFDLAFYLRTYPDVQTSIQQGLIASAYDHYRDHGCQEARSGRPDDVHGPHNEQVWANLFHTLDDLRAQVAMQDQRLESLKTRRATRLKLRQQAGA